MIRKPKAQSKHTVDEMSEMRAMMKLLLQQKSKKPRKTVINIPTPVQQVQQPVSQKAEGYRSKLLDL